MNYYERYCGDYARDTGHLSLQEHGAYTVMLDTYYATETPLPADYDALYRICRAMSGKERDAVRSVADAFFPVAEDGLRHNNKADALIEKARPRMEAARLNGRRGGRPIQEPSGLIEDNPVGLYEPSGKAPQHQHQHHSSKTKNKAQAPFVLPEWIPEEPWNAWIESRKKARKAPTDYAMQLAVMKLENYREQGHPPAQVLMQSAFNGWSGLFPPKEIK